MAALHRHVRDELLQVIVGDVLERGERVPAVLVEGGSVRGQVVGYEEGGGGLRHLRAGTRDQPTVKLEYKEGLICKYETAGQVLATMRMLISGRLSLCGLGAGVWACERLEALGSLVLLVGRGRGSLSGVTGQTRYDTLRDERTFARGVGSRRSRPICFFAFVFKKVVGSGLLGQTYHGASRRVAARTHAVRAALDCGRNGCLL